MKRNLLAERRFQSRLNAPRVSEEFGFQQRFRNRRAIDHHKRPRRAQTQVVNRARHQLFAATGRRHDQHRCVPPSEQPRPPINRLHTSRTADHSRQWRLQNRVHGGRACGQSRRKRGWHAYWHCNQFLLRHFYFPIDLRIEQHNLDIGKSLPDDLAQLFRVEIGK
jgi:hypothetical protein